MEGGINLCLNLMLNKELAQKRSQGNCLCQGCLKTFNKTNLEYKNQNVYWPATFPESGVCTDVSVKLYGIW
jgi:hypothetical protein